MIERIEHPKINIMELKDNYDDFSAYISLDATPAQIEIVEKRLIDGREKRDGDHLVKIRRM